MTANHNMLCRDCGFDTNPTEYYMVRDRIWAEAGMLQRANSEMVVGPHEYLCVGCLEQRLGRELRSDDFTSAPVNYMFLDGASDRLRSRITGANL